MKRCGRCGELLKKDWETRCADCRHTSGAAMAGVVKVDQLGYREVSDEAMTCAGVALASAAARLGQAGDLPVVLAAIGFDVPEANQPDPILTCRHCGVSMAKRTDGQGFICTPCMNRLARENNAKKRAMAGVR